MKTVHEIEKTISATMLAAGLRAQTAYGAFGAMSEEERICRIYAEMEWARLEQVSSISLNILIGCICGWEGKQSEAGSPPACPKCGAAFRAFP